MMKTVIKQIRVNRVTLESETKFVIAFRQIQRNVKEGVNDESLFVFNN